MSKYIHQLRKFTDKDANYVHDIDIKCFDNVWSREDWKAISNNNQASTWVGCYRHVPISFLVMEQQSFVLPNTDQQIQALHVHKLGVQEAFRHKGVGVRLLAFVHQQAKQHLEISWVTMSVPEWFVAPDGPKNCLGWLQKYKFKAITTLPEPIHLYGNNYDHYLFGFKLNK